MGAVYAAVDIKNESPVAIKLLHPKYESSSKITRRFYQEASLTKALDHPNICSAFDHGCTTDGVHYLVMPLLEGCSFSKLLKEHKPLPLSRIIHIAVQVLDALESAHRNKIVHRDLKPDNIFILSCESEDKVSLLDFGISKVLEKSASAMLTSTGMVLGTAYYLAPEQAKGHRAIDHRVDIYAMGVILYEAMVGRLPFEGESYNEVVYKILNDPYKAPRYINPSIPRRLEQVVMTAMSLDPLKRYATAREMLTALTSAAERLESSKLDDSNDVEVTRAETSPRHDGAAPSASNKFRRWGAAAGFALFLALGGLLWKWGGRAEDPIPITSDVTIEKRTNNASPNVPASRKTPPASTVDEGLSQDSPPTSGSDGALGNAILSTERAKPSQAQGAERGRLEGKAPVTEKNKPDFASKQRTYRTGGRRKSRDLSGTTGSDEHISTEEAKIAADNGTKPTLDNSKTRQAECAQINEDGLCMSVNTE